MNKNKKIFITLLLVFVIVIGAAGVLYSRLKQQLDPQLIVTADQQEKTEEKQTDSEEAQTNARTQESETEEKTEEETEEKTEEKERYKVPDFTVYDAQDNEVHLSDFLGKPVVVYFWTSWCGPCGTTMPIFEQKYRELGEEVQFMMINMTGNTRETRWDAIFSVQDYGYTFPFYLDPENDASMAFKAYNSSFTGFVDKEGYLVETRMGVNEETLQKGIDLIYP